MNERAYNLIMRMILAGLVIGMLGMIQPFSLALFKPAFLILFFCTLGYIVFSHVNPKPRTANETTGSAQEVAGQEAAE